MSVGNDPWASVYTPTEIEVDREMVKNKRNSTSKMSEMVNPICVSPDFASRGALRAIRVTLFVGFAR